MTTQEEIDRVNLLTDGIRKFVTDLYTNKVLENTDDYIDIDLTPLYDLGIIEEMHCDQVDELREFPDVHKDLMRWSKMIQDGTYNSTKIKSLEFYASHIMDMCRMNCQIAVLNCTRTRMMDKHVPELIDETV